MAAVLYCDLLRDAADVPYDALARATSPAALGAGSSRSTSPSSLGATLAALALGAATLRRRTP